MDRWPKQIYWNTQTYNKMGQNWIDYCIPFIRMTLKNYSVKLIRTFLEKSNSPELYFHFHLKKTMKTLIYHLQCTSWRSSDWPLIYFLPIIVGISVIFITCNMLLAYQMLVHKFWCLYKHVKHRKIFFYAEMSLLYFGMTNKGHSNIDS